jgi:hypothetical protein
MDGDFARVDPFLDRFMGEADITSRTQVTDSPFRALQSRASDGR